MAETSESRVGVGEEHCDVKGNSLGTEDAYSRIGEELSGAS